MLYMKMIFDLFHNVRFLVGNLNHLCILNLLIEIYLSFEMMKICFHILLSFEQDSKRYFSLIVSLALFSQEIEKREIWLRFVELQII